ncbi:hypothetical protein CYLTODRAFT_108817 [Cylindrobasidium torrendii FP15055 ss-10]|uniref:F-box domain-containing protein n=1 Tax=Cylindrobasidium torrendii FP15055 ss-10 TaxID=1314674 RepID=A0A0D7B182_9AGAR|nr:hypothetical protein CYLTODRAFT_108817 [Cylindrobasidium torrendii FP15055 ss-10]
MTVQRIPQELTDLILEHLDNDTAALKTCSLVASAFTRTCQALLFYNLHLQSESLAQLSQHVQSSPHIFKHVRRLKISELYASRWIVSTLQQDAFAENTLSHFTNVHSVELAFNGISWELLAPAQAAFRRTLSTATFPRLRDVSIEGVYYVPTADRMLDLIGPTIERLRLQNVHLKRLCTVDTIVADTSEEPYAAPNIAVMQLLSLGNLSMLLDLKRGDVVLPNMHTLEVLVQSWAEVKVLPFITQNARNLVIHWDFSNPGFMRRTAHPSLQTAGPIRSCVQYGRSRRPYRWLDERKNICDSVVAGILVSDGRYRRGNQGGHVD